MTSRFNLIPGFAAAAEIFRALLLRKEQRVSARISPVVPADIYGLPALVHTADYVLVAYMNKGLAAAATHDHDTLEGTELVPDAFEMSEPLLMLIPDVPKAMPAQHASGPDLLFSAQLEAFRKSRATLNVADVSLPSDDDSVVGISDDDLLDVLPAALERLRLVQRNLVQPLTSCQMMTMRALQPWQKLQPLPFYWAMHQQLLMLRLAWWSAVPACASCRKELASLLTLKGS